MMRMIFVSAALVLAGPLARAAELPPGLPGLQDLAPAAPAAEETGIQRPDAQRVLAELSAELRLSAKQEERIMVAVEKKTGEFDKLLKEYEEVSAEEKKWRYKGNELRHGMTSINKEMPDLIRDFLDDDQRQNFDAMLEARSRPAAARMKNEEPAAPAFEGAPQPARKKKLIKRRKLPRAGDGYPAAPSQADGAAVSAQAEEAPGFTMVDKEPAAPRKKRVLRKKAAPGAAASGAPAGEMENAPAGASPTGKSAPAPEDEEDAGSYP